MNGVAFVFQMYVFVVFRMAWLCTNHNIAYNYVAVDGRGEDMATELWLPVHF